MKKALTLAAVLFVVFSMTLFAGGSSESPQSQDVETQAAAPENPRIKLATTTSTDNSGLLGYLLPEFTKDTGYTVDVIAVGTGAALGLGEKGDVDVVFVHARSKEDEFVDAGYGVNRKDVMYNDFVILGPENDPAGIGSAETAADAMELIAEASADFVSRGDNSGTHFKELSLWETAGITPDGSWYKEAGQGMGAVITMTNDLQGYTLADRGTFLSMKDSIDLVVCFDGEAALFNPYGIIAVNPELQAHANYDGAMALIEWIVSDKGQQLIGDFKKGGEQLFYPDAR